MQETISIGIGGEGYATPQSLNRGDPTTFDGFGKSEGHASVWGTCAGVFRFDAGGRTGAGSYQHFSRRQINGHSASLCLVFIVAPLRVV